MKKLFCIALIALLTSLLLCSCGAQGQNASGTSVPTTSETGVTDDGTQAAATFFPIQAYAVYEVYDGNATGDFDAAMKANPLDAEIQKDMQAQDLAGTREQQVFFDTCLQLWQAELAHTVANFKRYLSTAQSAEFDAAQTAWEQDIEKNGNLDRTLLSENGVNLGTQYVPSALIATIEQYRERVFHIKYMTMLLETYTENPVPEQEQLWNTWEAENG